MAKEQGKVGNVNTYLSVELSEKFLQVKKYYGICTNADVVRFLIKKEARKINDDKSQPQLHSKASIPRG